MKMSDLISAHFQKHYWFSFVFGLTEMIKYLTDGASIRTVLLVVEHVFPKCRLAFKTRVTDVAERVGAQVRLEHVKAN